MSLQNPFNISSHELQRLVLEQDYNALEGLQGTQGLLRSLQTDRARGIATLGEGNIPLERRRSSPRIASPSWTRLISQLGEAWTLRVNCGVFLLLLLFVMDRSFSSFEDADSPVESTTLWSQVVAAGLVLGVAMLLHLLLSITRRRRMGWLMKIVDEQFVAVVRDGEENPLPFQEVVVGDIFILKAGDIVPCDSVFVHGHGLVFVGPDQPVGSHGSQKKALAFERLTGDTMWDRGSDCFLPSGSSVLEGEGRCVALAISDVGHKICRRREQESSPEYLVDNHTGQMISAYTLALLVAVVVFPLLLISRDGMPMSFLLECLDGLSFLLASATIMINQGPGILLWLTTSRAINRLAAENIILRDDAAWHNVYKTSTICFDKTGTMSEDRTDVATATIGLAYFFHSPAVEASPFPSASGLNEFNDASQGVRQMMHLAITCTAERVSANVTSVDTCLLRFIAEWSTLNQSAVEIVEMIPFSSHRKTGGAIVRLASGVFRLFLKGACQELLHKCRWSVTQSTSLDPHSVETTEATDGLKQRMDEWVLFLSRNGFTNIAICFKDLDDWPQRSTDYVPPTSIYEDLSKDLTLIGVLGLEDTLRAGLREEFSRLAHNGISIKMCTGDNLATARSAAASCGILRPDADRGVMDGPRFRSMSELTRDRVVERVQVLAQCTPSDKEMFVSSLRRTRKGAVVCVGNGVNDIPAFQAADLSVSITTVPEIKAPQSASHIVVMDGNVSKALHLIFDEGYAVHAALRFYTTFYHSATVNFGFVFLATYSLTFFNEGWTPLLSVTQTFATYVWIVPIACLVFIPGSPQYQELQHARRRAAHLRRLDSKSVILLTCSNIFPLCCLTFGIVNCIINDFPDIERQTIVYALVGSVNLGNCLHYWLNSRGYDSISAARRRWHLLGAIAVLHLIVVLVPNRILPSSGLTLPRGLMLIGGVPWMVIVWNRIVENWILRDGAEAQNISSL